MYGWCERRLSALNTSVLHKCLVNLCYLRNVEVIPYVELCIVGEILCLALRKLSITVLLYPLGDREKSAEYEEVPVGLGQGYLIRVCCVNENIHTRVLTCNHFAS